MLKVSVNKAIKYRNKINALVAVGNPVVPYVQVVATDEASVLKALEEGRVAYYKGFEAAAKAVEVLFTMRDLIAEANVKSGVSKVMTAIAAIEAQIALFEKLSVSVRGYGSGTIHLHDDVIAGIQHRLRLEKADPTKVLQATRVNIALVSDKDLEENRNVLRDLKLQVETLTEKRNEINYSHVVELPDDVVDFLKGEKLI